MGRDEVLKQTGIQADQLTDGVDVWQAFELSWLNLQGICKVAIARILPLTQYCGIQIIKTLSK